MVKKSRKTSSTASSNFCGDQDHPPFSPRNNNVKSVVISRSSADSSTRKMLLRRATSVPSSLLNGNDSSTSGTPGGCAARRKWVQIVAVLERRSNNPRKINCFDIVDFVLIQRSLRLPILAKKIFLVKLVMTGVLWQWVQNFGSYLPESDFHLHL